MKIGKLYQVCHTWLLPHSSAEFWRNCGPVMYIGEDIIRREDGKEIINHAVLVDGKKRIIDRTFLKFLEPLDENG